MSEAVISMGVVALGALIVASLAGAAIVPVRIRLALAFGPAVGFGLLSLMGFLGLSLGFSLRIGSLAFALAGILAGLGVARRTRLSSRLRPFSFRPERRTLVSALLLLLMFVMLALTARTFARERPRGLWDAVAMWNARAKLVLRAETEAPEAIRRLERGQPAYPLYLPLANAMQMSVLGRESVRTPFFTGLWTVLGLAGAFALFAPVRLRAPAAAAVLTTPVVGFWGFSQGADLTLAYLAFGALLGIASPGAPEGVPRVPALLSGFMLGLLPWVKEEGWLYAVGGLLLGLLLDRAVDSPDGVVPARVGSVVLGALPGWLAVAIFKLAWIGPSSVGALAAQARLEGWLQTSAWRAVAHEYSRHLLDLGSGRWGFAWPTLLLVVVLGCGRGLSRGAPERPLMMIVAAIAAAWAVFFPISPFGTETHLRQALERLLLQSFPLLVVGALWQLERRLAAGTS